MDSFIEIAGGVAAVVVGLFCAGTAIFAAVATLCGTFAFWSWTLGGPGFVEMCLR